eukprot:jgi/Tetstr1/454325/TSEL_041244.t1
MADLVSRAKAIVITKKTRAEVPLCLVFAAQSVETMVAHAAKSQPADLRVYPSEDDARKGSWGAPLQEFAARLRNQSGGGPLRQQLEAAQYTLPEGVLAFYVTPADRTGITDPSSAAGAASSSSTRSRASTDTITVMRAEIQAVWPRDDDDVYLPVQGALGEVVAPDWAAGLVVSRVRAAGIEGNEKDMRKRVTRFVRERRKAHLNAKASTVPAAQLVVAEEAASSAAWRRNDCGLLWASGHRGRPDAKARKLMAASSTAQPPGVVKTLTAAVLPPDAPLPRPPLTEKELCWMNAADKKQSDADKKRKRPVKKRPGKKLTVAESESEAEAEAEAEAARSSKRRVPRARKNKNKQ